MHAALVRDGLVVNVVVVDHLSTLLDPAFASVLDGAQPVALEDGVPCGPGWSYDSTATPPFTRPTPTTDAGSPQP